MVEQVGAKLAKKSWWVSARVVRVVVLHVFLTQGFRSIQIALFDETCHSLLHCEHELFRPSSRPLPKSIFGYSFLPGLVIILIVIFRTIFDVMALDVAPEADIVRWKNGVFFLRWSSTSSSHHWVESAALLLMHFLWKLILMII